MVRYVISGIFQTERFNYFHNCPISEYRESGYIDSYEVAVQRFQELSMIARYDILELIRVYETVDEDGVDYREVIIKQLFR